MKLVTVSQVQAIEKEADAGGLTYDQMMENAGQGLADIILSLYAGDSELEVVGLVGPGNNGGDTLVALSTLAAQGWKARAYLVKRKKDDLVKRFLEAGGEVLSRENPFEQLAEAIETADPQLHRQQSVQGVAFKCRCPALRPDCGFMSRLRISSLG